MGDPGPSIHILSPISFSLCIWVSVPFQLFTPWFRHLPAGSLQTLFQLTTPLFGVAALFHQPPTILCFPTSSSSSAVLIHRDKSSQPTGRSNHPRHHWVTNFIPVSGSAHFGWFRLIILLHHTRVSPLVLQLHPPISSVVGACLSHRAFLCQQISGALSSSLPQENPPHPYLCPGLILLCLEVSQKVEDVHKNNHAVSKLPPAPVGFSPPWVWTCTQNTCIRIQVFILPRGCFSAWIYTSRDWSWPPTSSTGRILIVRAECVTCQTGVSWSPLDQIGAKWICWWLMQFQFRCIWKLVLIYPTLS